MNVGNLTPAEINCFMEDAAKVVFGVQHLIHSSASVPPLTSSVLALWVMAGYLDDPDTTPQIVSMIEAVSPDQRAKLLELLARISNRPIPGQSVN